MRIERLKLVNFIGIKHGLDKEEIEIIFPDNGNVFTSLNSENGGGKTTILSQLHPFKDSFDERKELTLPGKIGIKEIDISHNGSLYKIKHIFDKKTTSFIEKDGVELNPNGGVRTFEDIVATELEVTKDYFKIGKIGSNTDNFVQFSTTQRKDYISTLIKDVEKYNEAYDIVSDKFKLDTDKLNTIGKSLSSLGESAIIQSALKANKKLLTEIENKILELNKEIAINENNEKTIAEKITKFDYISLKNTKVKLDSSIIALSTTIKTTEKMYQNTETFEKDIEEISALKNQLEILKVKQAVLESELETLKQNLIKLQNDKTATEAKLRGFSTYSKTEDTEKKLAELEENYNKILEKYSSLPHKNILEKNVSKLSIYLSKYEIFMNYILKEYNSLINMTFDENTKNIALFFTNDGRAVMSKRKAEISALLNKTENQVQCLHKEYTQKCSNAEKLDILKQRPKTCNIDTCPFISDALKYVNLPNELAELEKVIKNTEKELKELNLTAEQIEDGIGLYKRIYEQFKIMQPNENILYNIQHKEFGSLPTVLSLPINQVQKIFNDLKEEVETFITLYNELESLKTQIDSNKSINAQVKNSEKLISHFTTEANEIVNNINITNERLGKKNAELAEVQTKILSLSQYIHNIENLISARKELEESNKELTDINKQMSKYEDLSVKRRTIESDLLRLKNEFNAATNEKEKITKEITQQEISLARIKELNKQMAELNKTYANLKLVKSALSPKSGIPLVFIQAYLGQTELIANELLNLAFNGKFEIHFESDPKNFFIRVRTGDNEKNDIKLASQGEIALTTISISLALIEQSIGHFNILSLDEIDGALDTSNRGAFISILSSQVSKLGIEQVFIISHNNAFDSVPMNVIMLKGCEEKLANPDFMKNKTVIYSLE